MSQKQQKMSFTTELQKNSRNVQLLIMNCLLMR